MLAAALALTAAGCGEKKEPIQAAEINIDELLASDIVALAVVDEQPMNEKLVLSGHIACNPERVTAIVAPMEGRVCQVMVNEGDYVGQGACLAKVNSAQMAEIQRQLADAEQRIILEKKNLKAVEEMAAAGVIAEREVDQSRRQLMDAQGEKRRLDALMAYCHPCGDGVYALRSPRAGYVVEKRISSGMLLAEGCADTLMVVANTDQVWVMADVFEGEIGKVHVGQPVMVSTLAYPDTLFAGKVDCLYQLVDHGSKTVQARIVMDNGRHMLNPGMFVSSYLEVDDEGRKLPCVPSSSVVFENGGHYLVALQNGRAKVVAVKIALQQDGRCYVEDGLAKGDKVVSKNALLVYNKLQ